jgi:hypothetical protein
VAATNNRREVAEVAAGQHTDALQVLLAKRSVAITPIAAGVVFQGMEFVLVEYEDTGVGKPKILASGNHGAAAVTSKAFVPLVGSVDRGTDTR